ncbi:MAG: bifunctional enoyl-CoA hydratase/phosphate acetyltransferase [Chloroflexi bacterium]|nr:bifunctional enoyl-CoA hydratase/phosphate acetyltransferase [Chloroflexota bacterium]
MAIRSFEQLKYEAAWLGPKRLAIAAAANTETLAAAAEAQALGIASCILVDQEEQLKRLAESSSIDLSPMLIVNQADHALAARTVMQMARSGEAEVVMKGSLDTALFMQAAIDKEAGLRAGRLLTHVAVYEIPQFSRLLLISDGGVVVAPDLLQKMEIVQNAIDVAIKLGIEQPRAAVLAAAELVNPKIPSTLDAANLAKMAERGQIRGGVVDGPLALDNAISLQSAEIKGIHSSVAGQADILIVPDIEAGNLLGKAITYFAHGEMAGVVTGGYAPMVVTSRADSHTSKLVSIALAVLLVSGGYQTVRLNLSSQADQ